MSGTSPIVFDYSQLELHHHRAFFVFEKHRFLFDIAEKDILDRLKLIKKSYRNILILGARTSEQFLKELKSLTQCDDITICDIKSPFLIKHQGEKLQADEILPFNQQSFDLIVSPLTLHHTNDLPGVLIQLKHCLKPDGLFLGSLLGGETLYELRTSLLQTEQDMMGGASPRVSPFADKPQMGSLMQRAGFNLPVIDSDILKISYRSFMSLIQDIRGMGEGLPIQKKNKKYVGKNFFPAVARYYHNHFSHPDGTLQATFEVISVQGWAPHSSQQKALQPGSAKLRLADALGSQEVSVESPVNHQE